MGRVFPLASEDAKNMKKNIDDSKRLDNYIEAPVSDENKKALIGN